MVYFDFIRSLHHYNSKQTNIHNILHGNIHKRTDFQKAQQKCAIRKTPQFLYWRLFSCKFNMGFSPVEGLSCDHFTLLHWLLPVLDLSKMSADKKTKVNTLPRMLCLDTLFRPTFTHFRQVWEQFRFISTPWDSVIIRQRSIQTSGCLMTSLEPDCLNGIEIGKECFKGYVNGKRSA